MTIFQFTLGGIIVITYVTLLFQWLWGIGADHGTVEGNDSTTAFLLMVAGAIPVIIMLYFLY